MKRKAGAAALLLLLLGGAASGYEEDTHYYLSYLLARLGGMDHGSARVVASAAQAVDDSPATMPYRRENVSLTNLAPTVALEAARITEVLPRWHAMKGPAGEDGVKRRMVELYAQAKEGNNLVAFGQFAHFLQDSYSHQKDGERFSAPLGHLFQGNMLSDLLSEHRWPRDILGHSPDYLSTDPKKAQEMADAWLARVRLFVKETGRGDPGPKNPSTEKWIREILGVLIAARQQQLSHADTERQLNALLKREGLNLEVAPYRDRLCYRFDSDGKPLRIDLDKDSPPLPMPSDEATDRQVRRALEEAARTGELEPPSPRELLRSYQVLEQVNLGGALRNQMDARLDQLRKRRTVLDSGIETLKSELGPVSGEISRIEGDLKNLTDLDRGPCACGAPTHRQCKSKKSCDPIESELVRKSRSQYEDAMAKRDEKSRLIAASRRAVEELDAEILRWEKRRSALPAEAGSADWLPENLRSRIAPGAVLSRSLRAVLPTLFPYLPPGAVVSSGYRSPDQQLELIRKFALEHGVPWKEGATVNRPETWIEAWRSLLETKGVIVNPPVAATRSDGHKVPASPHTLGRSFDVSGGSLEAIEAGLEKARADGKGPFTILTEPVNNCVHVQIPD